MMDLEREQLRKTYDVCRIGFAILAAALILACFTSALPFLYYFSPNLCERISSSTWYHWIDVPITWLSLLAVLMLWGRFDHPSWQRRMTLLLIMSLVDTGLWFLDHGSELGLAQIEFGHQWLRDTFGRALGWAEFALLAGLSCDYLEHLGVDQAREAGKTARSMAATGAVLWLLLFFERTDWRAGWPLIVRARPAMIEIYLLYMATQLFWTITLFQVTALVVAAARESGRVLAEMIREDEADDILRPPSSRTEEMDLFRV